MDTNTFTLIFSGFTAIATVAAARSAILGPRLTAKHAGRLQKAGAERDAKMRIFMILMAHRLNYGQREPMQALNLIDLVWHNNKTICNAWSEFHASVQESSGHSGAQRDEKLRLLLLEMAKDLGLGDSYSSAGFTRVYYSNGVGRREQLDDLQVEAQLAAIQQMREQAHIPTQNAPV